MFYKVRQPFLSDPITPIKQDSVICKQELYLGVFYLYQFSFSVVPCIPFFNLMTPFCFHPSNFLFIKHYICHESHTARLSFLSYSLPMLMNAAYNFPLFQRYLCFYFEDLNLGKVNVHTWNNGILPTTSSRVKETEMRTDVTWSLAYIPQFALPRQPLPFQNPSSPSFFIISSIIQSFQPLFENSSHIRSSVAYS